MFSNVSIFLDRPPGNQAPSLERGTDLTVPFFWVNLSFMNSTKKKAVSLWILIGGFCLFAAAAPKGKDPVQTPKPPVPKFGWNAADLDRKLKNIRVPELNFFEVPLPDALNALQTMSAEHDLEAKTNPKFAGVQFVLLTRENPPPKITLKLRNARLGSILDFLVEVIGYEYQVRDAAIVVFKPKPRPAKKQAFRQLETEFFHLSEDMFRRMGGR